MPRAWRGDGDARVARMAVDHEVARDFGLEEARQPRARGEDEMARAIVGAIRVHVHDAACLEEALGALAAVKLRARALGEEELRAHARLGAEESRARLVVGDL